MYACLHCKVSQSHYPKAFDLPNVLAADCCLLRWCCGLQSVCRLNSCPCMSWCAHTCRGGHNSHLKHTFHPEGVTPLYGSKPSTCSSERPHTWSMCTLLCVHVHSKSICTLYLLFYKVYICSCYVHAHIGVYTCCELVHLLYMLFWFIFSPIPAHLYLNPPCYCDSIPAPPDHWAQSLHPGHVLSPPPPPLPPHCASCIASPL